MSRGPGFISGQISVAKRAHRSAGFSLAEALIALAIAAMLAAVLTRMVSNTRMSAGKIRELVEMITLGDSLLEQTPSPSEGTTAGRSGTLAWRISAIPIDFAPVPRRVNVKSADAAQGHAPSTGMGAGLQNTQNASTAAQPAPPPAADWIPYHVVVVIQSPSGRKYESDTISLGPRATDK